MRNIDNVIKTSLFNDDELDILENIYNETLKERKNSKKAKTSAENAVIQEAFKILEDKEEETKIEEKKNDYYNIGSVIVEITKEKDKSENVELSEKINIALQEQFVQDLILANKELDERLKLVGKDEYITIYSNYEKDE